MKTFKILFTKIQSKFRKELFSDGVMIQNLNTTAQSISFMPQQK